MRNKVLVKISNSNVRLLSFSSLKCLLTVFLDILSDSVAQALILGFQHYFVVLGTSILIPTILVPQMGGDLVSGLSTSDLHK